jgi:nucleotide-binding universal stress UspA family protein
MDKIRKILLASDFSARCDRPLDRALMLAREWSGTLLIVHVLEGGPPGAQKVNIEERAQALRRELPESSANVELILKTGSTPQVLAALANESDSDIIVTGVARYNTLGDYFLGTAVDYIVRHASVPVLVVRKRPLQPYRRLLVATDFSTCALHALNAAARLFPDIPIKLIHAWHVPYESFLNAENTRHDIGAQYMSQMARFLEQAAIDPLSRARISAAVEEGELGPAINRHIDPSGSDLLVLGTHGQSGFAHATIGSRASDLLTSAPTDVLIVRDRRT